MKTLNFNYTLEMMKLLEDNQLLTELSPESKKWAEDCLYFERERVKEVVKTLKEKQQAIKNQLNNITQELDSVATEIQILTS